MIQARILDVFAQHKRLQFKLLPAAVGAIARHRSHDRAIQNLKIYSGTEPVLETLLGRISQWCPKGSIDYSPPDHSLVELTRFRFPAMTFDESEIAECFGLEIGRLLVD